MNTICYVQYRKKIPSLFFEVVPSNPRADLLRLRENVLNMGTQIMMLFYVGVKRARQKEKTKNFKTDDEFR